MKNVKKLLVAGMASVLLFSLTGCKNLERYRYPCQDPANWKNAECNPPICEASGTCTSDILNTKTTDGQTATTESGQPNG